MADEFPDLTAAVTAALKRLLPLRHGNFTLEFVEDEGVKTEAVLQNPETLSIDTLQGVWVCLNAWTFDAAGELRDLRQQEVCISDDPRVHPDQLVAFLEGWRAALPNLLDRFVPPDAILIPHMVIDASLHVPSAGTAAAVEAALKMNDSPMKAWAEQLRRMESSRDA